MTDRERNRWAYEPWSDDDRASQAADMARWFLDPHGVPPPMKDSPMPDVSTLSDVAADALFAAMEAGGPGMNHESLAICHAAARRMVEAATLFGRRQRAYGPTNVVDMGGAGVARRVREKLTRIVRIAEDHTGAGGDELARDSALDVANFGIILAMVLDDAWPGARWGGEPV